METLQTVWGWQPALYLFLGGMGAGAFIASAVVFVREGAEHARLVTAGACASAVCLAVGLLLLLSELTAPLRGMMMWQSFSNFSSWMALGAWVVFAALMVFALMALCASPAVTRAVERRWPGYGKVRPRLGRTLAAVGLLCAVGVAAYTGVLLMSAPGVPLWNTPLLPVLFTVSALDTGIALVEVLSFALRKREAMAPSVRRMFHAGVVALVLLESAVLATLLLESIGMAMNAGSLVDAGVAQGAVQAAASAHLLVAGPLAVPFWVLVVAVGLVLPASAAAVSLADRKAHHPRLALVGAVGALAGGCALRFLMVLGGAHADPVAGTLAQLLGL